MKKVISIVGARPNYMKVAPIDKAFKKYSNIIEHIIVHTGQHYDYNMNDAFFIDLEIPKPKYFLGIGSGSHAEQTAKIMIEFEKICLLEKPDLVIVVGDVNSTIACILTAVKLGIKTAHVEGGLRSFDRTMPEEINRIATDSICNYCFITEESGLENLSNENFPKDNIFFVGNTMIDSLFFGLPKAKSNSIEILKKFNLSSKEFVLVTLHRPSNVDNIEQLTMLLKVLNYLSKFRKVLIPLHPRTEKNLKQFNLESYVNNNDNIIITEPLGYIDFVSLMLEADFLMTDSGGIQEETTTLGVPCLTLRTTTERPITCKLGTNLLIQPIYEDIIKSIDNLINNPRKKGEIPQFWDGKAGERITKIIAEEILK